MALILGTSKGLTSLEFQTGNLIKTYKQCENLSCGITLSGTLSSPTSILAVQANKPLIHSYSFKKEGVSKRIVTPGKLSCIKVSPNGKYLAGGAPDGTLYLWDMLSGTLFKVLSEAHFQEITVLEWSRDSNALVSGGKDARILVWSTMELVSQQSVNFKHDLTAHTLAITSCIIGPGSYQEARLYTASEDGTCGVYSIATGALLYTLVTDSKIMSLGIDPAERAVYLGCDDGLHFVPLYVESDSSKRVVSVGSSEGSAISTNKIETVLKLRQDPTSVNSAANAQLVKTIAVTTDGTHIICGYEDGQILGWEVGSKQLVKKFKSPAGIITQILFIDQQTQLENHDLDYLPILQRNVTDVEDYVPPQGAFASSMPQFQQFTSEIDEILRFAGDADSDVAEAGDKSHAPENIEPGQGPQVQELQQKLEHLQQMYDNLWAKYTSK